MAKIIGGTVSTPMPCSDWNQTNPNRADYIKNKPFDNFEEAVKSVGDDSYVSIQTHLMDVGRLESSIASASKPASTFEFGSVKVATDQEDAAEYGILGGNNALKILGATEADIDEQISSTKPITPCTIDYAVRTFGERYFPDITNTNNALNQLDYTIGDHEGRITTLEQNGGGGDIAKTYEKIATITVASGETPTHIIFSADSKGKAFELESFYVKALIGATDGTAARLAFAVNDNSVFGGASLGSMLSTTPRGWAMYYKDLGENEGALCVGQSLACGDSYPTTPNANNASFTGGVILPYMTSRFKPVTKISFAFIGGTAKTFTEGTKMELWGVRK